MVLLKHCGETLLQRLVFETLSSRRWLRPSPCREEPRPSLEKAQAPTGRSSGSHWKGPEPPLEGAQAPTGKGPGSHWKERQAGMGSKDFNLGCFRSEKLILKSLEPKSCFWSSLGCRAGQSWAGLGWAGHGSKDFNLAALGPKKLA